MNSDTHTYKSIYNEKKEIQEKMMNHFQELKLFLGKKNEEGATDKDSLIGDLVNWHNLLDDLFTELAITEGMKKDSTPAVTGVKSSSNKTFA